MPTARGGVSSSLLAALFVSKHWKREPSRVFTKFYVSATIGSLHHRKTLRVIKNYAASNYVLHQKRLRGAVVSTSNYESAGLGSNPGWGSRRKANPAFHPPFRVGR